MSSGQDSHEPTGGNEPGPAEGANDTSQYQEDNNNWNDVYTPSPPRGHLLSDTTIPLDSEGWQENKLLNENGLPDLLNCDEYQLSENAGFWNDEEMLALIQKEVAEIVKDRKSLQELKYSLRQDGHNQSEINDTPSLTYHQQTRFDEHTEMSVQLLNRTHRLQQIATVYNGRWGEKDVLRELSFETDPDSIKHPEITGDDHFYYDSDEDDFADMQSTEIDEDSVNGNPENDGALAEIENGLARTEIKDHTQAEEVEQLSDDDGLADITDHVSQIKIQDNSQAKDNEKEADRRSDSISFVPTAENIDTVQDHTHAIDRTPGTRPGTSRDLFRGVVATAQFTPGERKHEINKKDDTDSGHGSA